MQAYRGQACMQVPITYLDHVSQLLLQRPGLRRAQLLPLPRNITNCAPHIAHRTPHTTGQIAAESLTITAESLTTTAE